MANFPLPEVLSSLEPYIKTRQEILQIRRVLTVSLNSQNSALGLNEVIASAPVRKARVNSTLSDTLGKRKAYSKAVFELEKARDEHRSLAQAVVEDAPTDSVTTKDADVQDQSDFFQAHIALLNRRRRYEKLRILQDYLDLLDQKPASDIYFLDLHKMLQMLGEPPQLPPEILE